MILEMKLPKSVASLINELEKLPGIGPKTAERLTYHLLNAPKEYSESLSSAISQLKSKTKVCATCYNIAESNPCDVCDSSTRDKSMIMVVEDPLDILALEKSRSYSGLYHVLGGYIAPLQGIGPEHLRIKELLPRLKNGKIEEIILATNPSVEGESTAMYIQKLISPLGVKITRIARGLPVGADLEYADEVTLSRAIEGRREY
jgi:recombination protein RecR